MSYYNITAVFRIDSQTIPLSLQLIEKLLGPEFTKQKDEDGSPVYCKWFTKIKVLTLEHQRHSLTVVLKMDTPAQSMPLLEVFEKNLGLQGIEFERQGDENGMPVYHGCLNDVRIKVKAIVQL